MKTKLIISAAIIVLTVCFYSFKTADENTGSNIALVNSVFGKDNQDGFLISYGDGSTELKPFILKTKNVVDQTAGMSQLMNQLHAKGYRYRGMGSHTASDIGLGSSYMIFEKN